MSIEERIHKMLIDGRDSQLILPYLNSIRKVNKIDETGSTLLHKAVSSRSGYLPIVEKLVSLGANINAQDYSHQTPLLLAMDSLNLDMVDFLVTKGAEINIQTLSGKTVLHACIGFICFLEGRRQHRICKVISGLLKKMLLRGGDPNMSDENGETPLMLAVRKNNFTVVKELLIYGGNVHLRNKNLQTCLHLILNISDRNENIIFELVKRKACVNCTDKDGISVMDLILKHYEEEGLKTVKRLIKIATLANWATKMFFEVGTNQNLDNLREFIDDCNREVFRMKSCAYSDSSNLCHLALNCENVSQNVESPAESILDEVFETLMTNCFDIYDDLIIPYFNRKFLCKKFLEMHIYARNEKNAVVILCADINIQLFSHLSDQDLFNLARAYSKSFLASLQI